jgi:hypothetical protein
MAAMSSGAKALIDTLINAGVDTCFTNPGTSEMHFVAALDSTAMKAILCLFEGAATGAVYGYARMADKPAATLLHLGCGLGNGLANLHNARKARVSMINIIGDHATCHTQPDCSVAPACPGWSVSPTPIRKVTLYPTIARCEPLNLLFGLTIHSCRIASTFGIVQVDKFNERIVKQASQHRFQ